MRLLGTKFVPYTMYTYVPTLGIDGQWRYVAECIEHHAPPDERIQTVFNLTDETGGGLGGLPEYYDYWEDDGLDGLDGL